MSLHAPDEVVEAGRAVLMLGDAIERLRRTACPTMAFGTTPKEVALAARSELDELLAELVVGGPQTAGAQTEAGDLLGVVYHLVLSMGLSVPAAARAVALKIDRRLDHVDAGGTWASAKADGL